MVDKTTNNKGERMNTEIKNLAGGEMMYEVCRAFGWQGGTVHQVLREIARLREVEKAAKAFGDEVAFADMAGQIKSCNKGIARTGKILNDVMKKAI